MGLLYGGGDPDKTIDVATRCGQDSDCNPSSAAGILFTAMDLENVPDRFKSELNHEEVFSHTNYSFDKLIQVSEALARDAVLRAGGKIKGKGEKETFVIPVVAPALKPLEQSWTPGPIADSRYTEEELNEKIRPTELSNGRPDMVTILGEFAPGWNVLDCGLEMDPGLRADFKGRQKVLVTHPDDGKTPCVLWREGAIPAGSKGKLRVVVSHHDGGDWDLIVKINGKEVERTPVSIDTVKDGWLTLEVDLAPYAGQQVKAELFNQPTGWFCEAAYWAEVALVDI